MNPDGADATLESHEMLMTKEDAVFELLADDSVVEEVVPCAPPVFDSEIVVETVSSTAGLVGASAAGETSRGVEGSGSVPMLKALSGSPRSVPPRPSWAEP